MPNKELRRQIEFVWEQFWHAGLYDPAEILEQILYLLFLRRLDDKSRGLHAGAPRVRLPVEEKLSGPNEESLRWSVFLHLPDRAMFALLSDHVYPRLRVICGPGLAYAPHRKHVHLALPSAAALANIVRLLERLPRSSIPGISDPFEYVADKLATVGQRGGFPTPSAIAMVNPGGMSALVVAGCMAPGRSGAKHKVRRMSMYRLYRAIGSHGLRAGTTRRRWWGLVEGRWPDAHLHGGSDKHAAAEARCERCVGVR